MTEQTNGKTENVIIVGSGPAGWTAAIYAARANLSPLVFPGRAAGKDLVPGGQLMLTTDVENYPGFPEGVSGPEMMIKFYEQAMRFDTRVATDDGIKDKDGVSGGLFTPSFLDVKQVDLSKRPFKVTADNGSAYHAHALIVATGAKAKWLGLDNEMRLATSGGGVSACAVCDGALPMFRDQPLGVVGGGDTAMEEALYLAKYASKVHVFVRRDQLRASDVMADRASNNDKIEFHWHTEVTDVLGDEKITGVKLINNQTDEESEMELGGLFLAIGHKPITDFLEGQVEMDDVGYIELADAGRSLTSVEGVFAAGDVADATYRQAVTAAGMGCRAAIDAERWLGEQGIE
ncbi:MAG: FAD-dependent oxidoreductase [Planctomycetes bacterium]|jgi:thioredoxin reductase (NADPH)|nr:FAD-dependent oxidoreductase [Planctomycetota bacterium]